MSTATPFAWAYKKFTLEQFAEYVHLLPATQLAWFRRITIHHTYIPTLAQWKAAGDVARMHGVANYYRNDLGWPAGPNLFITDTHILQGTPITQSGIHATICNANSLGLEVVGDYNRVPWSPGTEHMVLGAIAILFRKKHMSVSPDTLNGHRDCNSPKTCPGESISMDMVRRNLKRNMGMPTIPIAVPAENRLVIGVVKQTATFAQWSKYLRDNGVTVSMLSHPEMQRIYDLMVGLNIDAAFMAAVWKQESFKDNPNDEFLERAVIGGGDLQRQSRNPLNMKSNEQEHRQKVFYNGVWWLGYSTWQAGWLACIVHVKNEYGDHRGILTLEDFVNTHAPKGDGGNDPPTFIANIKTRMAAMAAMAAMVVV